MSSQIPRRATLAVSLIFATAYGHDQEGAGGDNAAASKPDPPAESGPRHQASRQAGAGRSQLREPGRSLALPGHRRGVTPRSSAKASQVCQEDSWCRRRSFRAAPYQKIKIS